MNIDQNLYFALKNIILNNLSVHIVIHKTVIVNRHMNKMHTQLVTIKHRNNRYTVECVLLSFFSENFVSTKWRIYKGIFGSSRLLREGISCGRKECGRKECDCFFLSIISMQLRKP